VSQSFDPILSAEYEESRRAGTELMTRIAALLRVGRSYSVQNQLFRQQLEMFAETLAPYLRQRGEMLFVAYGGEIFLDGMRVTITSHGFRMAKTLNVAGAYHSRLMNPAFEKLGEVLQQITFQPPSFPVICNVDACKVSEPDEIRQSLQDQVTGTVCWTETQELLVDDLHCDLFIELGPGGVLCGLLNRTRKGTVCVSISDCATLDAAVALIRA